MHGFTLGPGGEVRFALVRDAQSLDSLAAESGLAHADALTGPAAPTGPGTAR